MQSNFNFSLIFCKVSNTPQKLNSLISEAIDRIDYQIKYFFSLNDSNQILINFKIGIELINDVNEIKTEITVETAYLIEDVENLKLAKFEEFLSLFNSTFDILNFNSQEKLMTFSLGSLEKPDFIMYSEEFIEIKDEFLKLYFPSPH